MEKSHQAPGKQVLFNYQIKSCPAKHLAAILDREQIKLVRVHVDDNSCGMYTVLEGKKLIYINETMSKGRTNFTIAHELGHHFLMHRLNDFCQLYRCTLKNMNHKNDPQEAEAGLNSHAIRYDDKNI
ncbi:ImmA/IrrE family metallo-endopeptidase [Paenibacillus sp. HJGM_3]|uniref:ImmA/IrrE family metallo-endopeptidase n=1 Tax=Paenibacillus sp. HJGM_3 TaxID=3379816 RepID=UPI00385BEB6E